jgi:hypothetical protein
VGEDVVGVDDVGQMSLRGKPPPELLVKKFESESLWS